MRSSTDKETAITNQLGRFGHPYNPSDKKDIGKPRISFTKDCPYPNLTGKTWVIEEIKDLKKKGYEVSSRSRCDILSGILGDPKYGLKEGKDFEIIYPQ
ncbi:hypothetical protein ACFLZS_00030 [Patescibacteria group bacterium]